MKNTQETDIETAILLPRHISKQVKMSAFQAISRLLESSCSSMNFFHTGCCFHTLSAMESIGTPLVSGRRNTTNIPIARIQAEKKKKINARMWQSIERNDWAMTKVMSMFELTAKAKPAVLVSTGKVSLGINHPSGPHDQAKHMT